MEDPLEAPGGLFPAAPPSGGELRFEVLAGGLEAAAPGFEDFIRDEFPQAEGEQRLFLPARALQGRLLSGQNVLTPGFLALDLLAGLLEQPFEHRLRHGKSAEHGCKLRLELRGRDGWLPARLARLLMGAVVVGVGAAALLHVHLGGDAPAVQ